LYFTLTLLQQKPHIDPRHIIKWH